MTDLRRSDSLSEQVHPNQFNILCDTCTRFPDRTIFYAKPRSALWDEHEEAGLYYRHVVTGRKESLYIYAVDDTCTLANLAAREGFSVDSIRIVHGRSP